MVERRNSMGARLLAIGLVVVVLGSLQLLWSGGVGSDAGALAMGALSGGVVVALVGGYLLLRHRNTAPPPADR